MCQPADGFGLVWDGGESGRKGRVFFFVEFFRCFFRQGVYDVRKEKEKEKYTS